MHRRHFEQNNPESIKIKSNNEVARRNRAISTSSNCVVRR